MAIEFADVARLLSCREFAEGEGMKMRGGRAVCPFHAGADGYNLAFYERDGRCHCFKCGTTADVVKLASSVWSCSQVEAADELNRRYDLRLDKAPTAAEADAWQRKRRQRDDKQQAAEAAVEAAEAEARAAWAAVNTSTSTADRDELQRRAKNAADWLAFKRMELRLANGEVK